MKTKQPPKLKVDPRIKKLRRAGEWGRDVKTIVTREFPQLSLDEQKSIRRAMSRLSILKRLPPNRRFDDPRVWRVFPRVKRANMGREKRKAS